MPEPTSRRRRVVVPIAVAAIVAAAVVTIIGAMAVGGEDSSSLERARALVADPGRFDSGEEAATTLARVAQHLNDAVRDCTAAGDPVDRCEALSAASGYAQVLAVRTLTCTAPGRFEARTGMSTLLDLVARAGGTPDDPPDIPRLPEC